MDIVITGIVVLALSLAVGYAGYLAGRERAERKAAYTIATLRNALRRSRETAMRNDRDIPDWVNRQW